MEAPRPIGILGGMGPEATILLQQKLLDAVPARDDADHIPLLIDMNPQVPSRIARLIDGTGADPEPVLVAMAQRLEAAGAQALAMPCNTAHLYASAVRAAVSVPFLDMVALCADHAARALGPGGKVGVLASPAVRMTGLFDRVLAARGLETLWPEDDAPLLETIRTIKANGPGAEVHLPLARAADALAAQDAGQIVIACTEFSLVTDRFLPAAPVVDALDLLVRAIVAQAKGPDDAARA